MSARVRLVLLLAAVAAVALTLPSAPVGGPAAAPAAHTPRLSDEARDATFRFAPGTAAADRDLVRGAVARARPEARRLVALVDGLTEVGIGPAAPGALGTTSDLGDGYLVVLDLARVLRHSGGRGVDRVVLHELGHVLDRALVDDETMAVLMASIPAGWGCEGGRAGACAAAEERFAETFAKWATNDIGADLLMGYKVPPPSVPLDVWARPLAVLGR